MAVREILRMGDARLLRVAQPVPDEMFGSAAIDELVTDLLDSMKAANGAGIAAPQIGVDLRLVIFGGTGKKSALSGCAGDCLHRALQPGAGSVG